jgi:tetratricopeptide (TPR) repeat protein
MNSLVLTREDLIEKRKYKAAFKVCVKILRLDPIPEDFAKTAVCLYRLKKFSFAKQFAEESIRLSSGACDTGYLVLANTFTEEGSFKQAVSCFLHLAKKDSNHSAYIGLASVSIRRGNLKRGKKILELLRERESSNHLAYLSLGEISLIEGDQRKAWEYFNQCIKLDQDCLEAWCGAFKCACILREYEIALTIADKITELDCENPISFECLGQALFHLCRAEECREAYGRAYMLANSNIVYYLNSLIPSSRIPESGSKVHSYLLRLVSTSTGVVDSFSHEYGWRVDETCSLLPLLYYIAYSPYNLKRAYSLYYQMLGKVYGRFLREALECVGKLRVFTNQVSLGNSGLGEPAAIQGNGHNPKIRLGLISRYFSSHSNMQAFGGLIKNLDHDKFELVLIHRHETNVDATQLMANSFAAEVVYLDESLALACSILRSLSLDILFFTDLGMDPLDFLIPELRTCPIQVTGWGLPHTSGLSSIDYYLSSSLLESEENQNEYTEKLVLLDGLPCCYSAENIQYRRLERDYFILPRDRVLLGCVQNFWKIHPDFDLILEKLAQAMNDVVFVFVDTGLVGVNQKFVQRLAKRAPTAYSQSVFLARCDTKDFLSLCDCLDILLDTPYYGAGVTAYMSMYVGTPTVCFDGKRLRDSTTAGIYRYLGIDNAPIADSIAAYIQKVIELASDPDQRFQIKLDTVNQAHRLYDNLEYVRSFEKFCIDLMRSSKVDEAACAS